MGRVVYFHWLPFLAFLILLVTNAFVYIFFVADEEPPRGLHLSNILSNLCSDSVTTRTSTSIGIFGYGVFFMVLAFLFVRLWERDLTSADTRNQREWAHFKLGVALVGIVAFQFMLGFPSGFGDFGDDLHRVSAGVGVGLLLFYAIFRFDLHNDSDVFSFVITIWRNLSIVLLVVTALVMLVTFFLGRNEVIDFNVFSAAQLAYGIAFGVFLLSLSFTRELPKGKEG